MLELECYIQSQDKSILPESFFIADTRDAGTNNINHLTFQRQFPDLAEQLSLNATASAIFILPRWCECVAQGAQYTGLLPGTICTLGVTSSCGQEWKMEVKEWQVRSQCLS